MYFKVRLSQASSETYKYNFFNHSFLPLISILSGNAIISIVFALYKKAFNCCMSLISGSKIKDQELNYLLKTQTKHKTNVSHTKNSN